MLVDVVYPGRVLLGELTQAKILPDWIRAHSQILEYDFTTCIEGHLDRYGTRRDVAERINHRFVRPSHRG